MKRAIGMVTAMSALATAMIVGCSITTTVNGEQADAGAPSEGGAVSFRDARKDVEDDVDVDALPTLTCPASLDPVDATTYPWKSPRLDIGACTEAELADLVAYATATTDPQKWKTGPWTSNERCRACVSAKDDGSTWPPLVENAAGQLARINYGACFAMASGDDACGRTYQQWRDCRLEACDDCPSDAAKYEQCFAFVDTNVCKTARSAVVTACGGASSLAALESRCASTAKASFEASVRAQCIGLDGGL